MKKQTLGMTIASLRKTNGMTQLELAEKLGVTDKAVSKWERDICYPDLNTLPRIAELFGVSVDELMLGKGVPEEQKEKRDYAKLINLIFTGVGLAMGIAVAVLSALHQVDTQSAVGMLGIGLACTAISVFPRNQ